MDDLSIENFINIGFSLKNLNSFKEHAKICMLFRDIVKWLNNGLQNHQCGFDSYCPCHLITNILIQTKGLKMKDICSRNRAFFNFWRFASREKLV